MLKYPYGDSAVDFVLQTIQKKYPNAQVVENKDYQILVPENGTKIKVVEDLETKETQTVPLYIEMDGQPAGPRATEATIYAFIVYHRAFFDWVYKFVPTHKLKRDLRHVNERDLEIGDNYKLKHFPLCIILNYTDHSAVPFHEIERKLRHANLV